MEHPRFQPEQTGPLIGDSDGDRDGGAYPSRSPLANQPKGWGRGRSRSPIVLLAGRACGRVPGEQPHWHFKLWVLRSTITLKTTVATLVSVDGDIGQRGALVHPPYASPKSTTEGTPSATVTPTQSRSTTFAISMDVVRRGLVTELRTRSWHRSKPFSVANIKLTGLCKGCTQGL